jgi:hypothetical protein
MPWRAHHRTIDPDLAPGDILEARNAAQQCSLATTGRPQQAGDTALLEPEVDPIHDGLVAIALDNRPEF